jgi:hypothetical protein
MRTLLGSEHVLIDLLRRGLLAARGDLHEDGSKILESLISQDAWKKGRVVGDRVEVEIADGKIVWRNVRIVLNPLVKGASLENRSARFRFLYLVETLTQVPSKAALQRALTEGYPRAWGIRVLSAPVLPPPLLHQLRSQERLQPQPPNDASSMGRYEEVPVEAFAGMVDWEESCLVFMPSPEVSSEPPWRRKPIMFRDVRVELEEFERVFPCSEPIRRGGPGRKRIHDWTAFWKEVAIRCVNYGLPAVQAELVRDMEDWFESKFGKAPEISQIKRKIRELYAAIK